MWRIWNSIPRVLRQHFHGPRTSAGVYVEEEREGLELEKYAGIINISSRNKSEKVHPLAPCAESNSHDCGEAGGTEENGRGANHKWYKWQNCSHDFWSLLNCQHRALDAVALGAAMVFGFHLSRHHCVLQYLEFLKDRDKRKSWMGFLFRVAFAMPPDMVTSVRHSIVQQEDAGKVTKDSSEKEEESIAFKPTDKNKSSHTLEDIMREFEAMCHQYAAVGSSISGLSAAEEGQMTSAIKYLRMSSQLGHAPAYFNLGLCYQMGYGVDQDLKQAAAYYKLASEAGHVQAIFNLAIMTLRGEGGVKMNREMGIELLNKAAMQGLAQAQTYLGVYYTEDDDNQQDFEQAASFFRAAADQNDPEGQYFLGICYENGWGVESSDQEAAKLYKAAAEKGHDWAMYNLAAFHEYGLGGLHPDINLAMDLYSQSAQTGNESAKFRLQEAEARKAMLEWNDEDSAEICTPPSSPVLRKSPYSSSPTLTDYVRQSLAKLWTGTIFSPLTHSDTVIDSEVKFVAGAADFEQETDHWKEFDKEHLSQLAGSRFVPKVCMPGLQRTSTMPDLLLSCG